MASMARILSGWSRVAGAEAGERLRRGSLGAVALTLFMTAFGGQWDVNWHLYVGRDWFWIPPHVLIYSGVAAAGLIALIVTGWYSLYGPTRTKGEWGLLGVRAPVGFALIGLGALAMVASAPFDDWWHRRYGIDVTIWSPPHLGGVVGSTVTLLGVLVESAVGPAGVLGDGKRREWLGPLAFALASAGLLRTGLFGNIPASQYTFWGDDYSFQFFGWHNPYLFPVLMSVFGAYVMTAAARITRRGWMPLVVLGLALAINRLAQWVADYGTDALARATGHAFRFGRYELGFSAEQMFLWPLAAMILPIVVSALALHLTRRMPDLPAGAIAGGIFGLALFVEFGVYISRSWPARQLPLPDSGVTPLSLGLCLGLGALSGLLGASLARAVTQLSTDSRSPLTHHP